MDHLSGMGVLPVFTVAVGTEVVEDALFVHIVVVDEFIGWDDGFIVDFSVGGVVVSIRNGETTRTEEVFSV